MTISIGSHHSKPGNIQRGLIWKNKHLNQKKKKKNEKKKKWVTLRSSPELSSLIS
jgi:hypothetical protein